MTKPIAQISFTVDIEIEYDPFKGRTPEQFAEIVHDDLIDSLALAPFSKTFFKPLAVFI